MRLRQIFEITKSNRATMGDAFSERLKMLEPAKRPARVQASLFRTFKNRPERRAA